MTKLIQSPENLQDIPFPLAGLDLSAGFGEQRPGTTSEAVNVRGIEPLAERARGGSRPGLARYLDDQVPPSEGEIQDLNLVILPSAEAQGISFDDVAVLDTIFQLEDPSGARALLGDLSTGWIYVGGSGYHTPKTYTRQHRPRIDSVSPADIDFAGGDTVTILGENLGDMTATVKFGTNTATVLSNDGSTAIVTSPSYSPTTADVTLDVSVQTTLGRNENTANDDINYNRIRHVQSTGQGFDNSTSARSLAFTSNVTAGNLLLAWVSTYGIGADRTVSLTDTQGNTWILAGYAATVNATRISLWYCRAGTSGPCTVTFTPSATVYSGFGLQEYSGVKTSNYLDDEDNSDLIPGGSPMRITSLSVAANGSLVVCGFSQDFFGSNSFTPGAGFTSRITLNNGSTASTLWVEDELEVAAGSIQPSGTVTSFSSSYVGVGAVFKRK